MRRAFLVLLRRAGRFLPLLELVVDVHSATKSN
jgi:hypothetical protein